MSRPAPSQAPLATAARRVQRPTIFIPGLPSRDPVELARFDDLSPRLAAMAAGRPLDLVPTRAAYPGFDDFWAITVRASGDYVCTIADRWHDAGDRDAALRVLRADGGRRVAA